VTNFRLKYPVRQLELKIADLKVKLAIIKNNDKLIDDFFNLESNHPDVINENIPYWGELWPSAIGLAQFISEHAELVNKKNLLEIGCGLGLPGIVAALLGAKVTMTDYLPDALKYAMHNWNLNISSKPDIHLLDWTKPGTISPFDVLIASDIAYESRSFLPLIDTLKKLVHANGTILISEPNRAFAQEFFDQLKNDFSIISEDKIIKKDGLKYTITIYLLTSNI